jgi:hypothetical protein
MKKRILEKEKE